jgi:hypothetical protein
MNRLLLVAAFSFAALSFTACTTTSNKLVVDGVPGWVRDGAQLEYEPAPVAPDIRVVHQEEEDESGPLEFNMITDKREYPDPPEKKAVKPGPDPLEPGRDRRIDRLVR